MLIEEHGFSSVLMPVEIDLYLLILKKDIIKQNCSKKEVTKTRQMISKYSDISDIKSRLKNPQRKHSLCYTMFLMIKTCLVHI